MNEPIEPIEPTLAPSPLQFDRAEIEEAPAGRQAPSCAFCRNPLHASYFDINGQMACEACRFKIEEQLQKGPGVAGFFRAGGAGLAAAIAGCGLYFAVRALTGYDIGLISILVGLMVGKAVSWGSRGHGGWVYQSLAMFLTYMAIAGTYIPLLITEFREQAERRTAAGAPAPATPQAAAAPGAAPSSKSTQKPAEKESSKVTFGEAVVALAAVFVLAALLHFLAGFENVIGLLIIAFGLWEAWKTNKRQKVEILGPLDLGAAPPLPPIVQA